MPGSAGTCGVDPSAPSYDVWRAGQAKRGQAGSIGNLLVGETKREYRDDICQIGRLVFQKGWVAANDGNIRKFFSLGILKNIPGIYKMDYDAIANMDGFGQKSIDNLRHAVESSKKQSL